MACLRLGCAPQDFDFQALLEALRRELPAYAVPLFLRLSTQLETAGTFKHKKTPLKEQGYDVARCEDPLYAWLPGSDRYVPLTPALQAEITAGRYRYRVVARRLAGCREGWPAGALGSRAHCLRPGRSGAG